MTKKLNPTFHAGRFLEKKSGLEGVGISIDSVETHACLVAGKKTVIHCTYEGKRRSLYKSLREIFGDRDEVLTDLAGPFHESNGRRSRLAEYGTVSEKNNTTIIEIFYK